VNDEVVNATNHKVHTIFYLLDDAPVPYASRQTVRDLERLVANLRREAPIFEYRLKPRERLPIPRGTIGFVQEAGRPRAVVLDGSTLLVPVGDDDQVLIPLAFEPTASALSAQGDHVALADDERIIVMGFNRGRRRPQVTHLGLGGTLQLRSLSFRPREQDELIRLLRRTSKGAEELVLFGQKSHRIERQPVTGTELTSWDNDAVMDRLWPDVEPAEVVDRDSAVSRNYQAATGLMVGDPKVHLATAATFRSTARGARRAAWRAAPVLEVEQDSRNVHVVRRSPTPLVLVAIGDGALGWSWDDLVGINPSAPSDL